MKNNQEKKIENRNLKKSLGLKGITLIATGALLVVLLIAGAAAWYTRLSSVNKITLEAANFDFKANYKDQTFVVQAADYINVNDRLAAPGTAGVIPINVWAQDSDVDVNYSIKISTENTADEFKRRIRYFYFTKENGELVQHTFDDKTLLKGFIKKGTTEPQYEFIYWEWVYDLSPEMYYISSPTNAEVQGWYFNGDKENFPFSDEECEAFDEFDSQIGEGKLDDEFDGTRNGQSIHYASSTDADGGTLFAYQNAMQAEIRVSGAQVIPIKEDDDNKWESFKVGDGAGSVKVEMADVNELLRKGTRQ